MEDLNLDKNNYRHFDNRVIYNFLNDNSCLKKISMREMELNTRDADYIIDGLKNN